MKVLTRESSPQSADRNGRGLLNHIWVQGAAANVGLVAVLFGVLMFVCSLGLDWILLRNHEDTKTAFLVSNGLAGLVAGLLALRLLQFGRERRRMIEQRLETISDMNHHIRNALQVISFSVRAAGSQKELAEITESMERIQWALREILPKVEPAFTPFEGSAKAQLSKGQQK